MKSILLILSLFVLTPLAMAANVWKKVPIPGARCGRGGAYSVFIRKGASQNLAIGMSGGGACWSYRTCLGPAKMTSLYPKKSVNLTKGIYSTDKNVSAVATYTHLYFPYCTGDVYALNHTTRYMGTTVYHEGRKNVETALEYLRGENFIAFDQVDKLVVFGHSAGAIGAMLQLDNFDRYTPHASQRTLVADAPGLHFGDSFWSKFPSKHISDFKAMFDEVGLTLDVKTGNVAQQVPTFCSNYPHWNLSFLQGSKDYVMSIGFGNISSSGHHRLVFGPQGLLKKTEDPTDNCAAWVPVTTKHTFLTTNSGSKVEVKGKTSMAFANDQILGLGGPNYK